MSDQHKNDPLHGVTLKAMLEELVERRGWANLAEHIQIRCFMFDPSIGSSLKFLRRTPWARERLEQIYVEDRKAIDRFRESQ